MNLFSKAQGIGLFRLDLVTVLKEANTGDIRSFKRADDVPGLAQKSLGTILDTYTGKCDKLEHSVDQTYSPDERDDSLIIHNSHMLNGPQFTAVLLHLVRLYKITELNLRSCEQRNQLSKEAQDVLAACQITRLVPPLSKASCRMLYLMLDSLLSIQSAAFLERMRPSY